jgi:hypothetical protein
VTRAARTLASVALRLVLAFGLVVAVFAMHSAALGTADGGHVAGTDPMGQFVHDRGAHEPGVGEPAVARPGPGSGDADAAHHHPGGTTLSCSSSACSTTVLTLVALVACCPARPRNVWPRVSSFLAAPLDGPEPPVPRALLSA